MANLKYKAQIAEFKELLEDADVDSDSTVLASALEDSLKIILSLELEIKRLRKSIKRYKSNCKK